MADFVKNIIKSGISIYDTEAVSNPSLFIPTDVLEALLNNGLKDINLTGLPLRTRSKFIKALICKALGFPVPISFKKTKPSFPALNMDIYTQKSSNLQIWNEEIESTRRYAIIQVNNKDRIQKVKLITGKELAKYDKTGTLTTKYQAMLPNVKTSKLLSKKDTSSVQKWCCDKTVDLKDINPTSIPVKNKLVPINTIYKLIKELEGTTFSYIDSIQERNRGNFLHQLICEKLGFTIFADKGTFPDILNQLIEVKLQTSPTIDLGRQIPDDNNVIYSLDKNTFTNKDIRYVIVCGTKLDNEIRIQNILISTGEEFFKHFQMFGGKVKNTKIQLPLPLDFFN